MTYISSNRTSLLSPREKLQAKGPAALTNLELLKAIIGSGNAQASVSQIASSSLAVIDKAGANLCYTDLASVKGLGVAKIVEILASIELSRRYINPGEMPIIDSPAIANEVLSDIKNKKQEHFATLTLDGANRLINKRIITIGTLTSSLVHPREVFADAISDRAASIIVGHNHPSGSLIPSGSDYEITGRLQEAGQLLDIILLDHLIVTSMAFGSIILPENTKKLTVGARLY